MNTEKIYTELLMEDRLLKRFHYNSLYSPRKYRNIWVEDFHNRVHYLNEVGLFITGQLNTQINPESVLVLP